MYLHRIENADTIRAILSARGAFMRYLPDVLAIAGAALVVHGMHLVYAPSAYVIAGAFLFYTASRLPR